jgi:hypothetical protein
MNSISTQDLLHAQRDCRAQHDPRKPLDQVVDRIQDFPGRERDTNARRLQRQFGALHRRDQPVQRASHCETDQSALEQRFVLAFCIAIHRCQRGNHHDRQQQTVHGQPLPTGALSPWAIGGICHWTSVHAGKTSDQ